MPAKSKDKSGKIHIGVGGWTFEPWRGVFYPKGLTQAKELSYAAQQLTSIEINGTYYGSQKPESFRKWASEVPDGFIFSVKGPRFATNRRVLAEAGDSIKRFFDSGVTEMGDRLGPLLWQFAPTKKFDAADFGKFLELLPETFDKRKIRHAIEVRNAELRGARSSSTSRGITTSPWSTPSITNIRTSPTSPPISSMRGCRRATTTSRPRIRPRRSMPGRNGLTTWAKGGAPNDLACRRQGAQLKAVPRDVFAYIIHEGKIRAPHGAMELIKRVQ